MHKCCPINHYVTQTSGCVPEKVDKDTIPWTPTFSDWTGKENLNPFHRIITGIPNCRTREPWLVFQYNQDENPCEKLVLLSDGTLRHYVLEQYVVKNDSYICKDQINEETRYQDYNISVYCIDRVSLCRLCVLISMNKPKRTFLSTNNILIFRQCTN